LGLVENRAALLRVAPPPGGAPCRCRPPRGPGAVDRTGAHV